MTLIVDNLSHRYGEIEALREVSVRARRGAVTCVLGPNAAGKSTLLRCMIGALTPSEGCVRLDGRPAHRLDTWRLAHRVAYVPQRSSVAAAFTVRQVVELGRYALKPNRRRIDEAMERMELTDLVDRPYSTLSVGQQQRVTLARALAQLEPNGHLVLDEPMSAMDLRHVRDGMAILRETAQQGATVITAMHDLALAALATDEAWLLDGGRLVDAGETCSVLNAEQLERVFEVGFEWVTGRGGRPSLVPDIPAGPSRLE